MTEWVCDEICDWRPSIQFLDHYIFIFVTTYTPFDFDNI